MSIFNEIVAKSIPFVPKAIVKRISSRYIAGETVEQAIQRLQQLQDGGFASTVDVLGESIANFSQAEQTADEYITVLDAIQAHRLHDANISVKPSALGLLLDERRCERTIERLLSAAKDRGIFVRIDMENVSCTQKEIDLFQRLSARFDNVGLVLQAYLMRTYQDIEPLIQSGANLRLCKGIYVEEAKHLVEGALKDRRAINTHFLHHILSCFKAGTFVGIATHDEDVVQKAIALAREMCVDPSKFEFQMLLGVCEPLRDAVQRKGYKVRIYVPYGKDWYGYSTRRLNENPQIAGYLLKSLLSS